MQKLFNNLLHTHAYGFGVFVAVFAFVFFAGGLVVANGQTLGPSDSKVVNLYVDNQEKIVPTRAETVGELLANAGIKLREADLVEPQVETPIDQDNFTVHVYRAKPVTIIDGSTQTQLLSPYGDSRTIAEKAGISTFPEDVLAISQSDNFVNEKIVGKKITIDRASQVTVSMFGAPPAPYRTQASTVGEFLDEKDITLEEGASLLPAADTKLTGSTQIFISKKGKKIVFKEESVPYPIQSTPDPTQPQSKTTIITKGVKGKKQVVYEVSVNASGKETGRRVIQEVITLAPVAEISKKGTKPGTGLSKSKGVNMFLDSKGVLHRETYYDLPMAAVMRNCGAGGNYSVRADGAKIDKDGHVIIAANLRIYPRCSIVETSLGSGKVYDTGGFALVHPHGYDLATDWSNNNGR